ncbi:MAG: AMP-binding protein, partial [Gammaproteobacteria bacterium]
MIDPVLGTATYETLLTAAHRVTQILREIGVTGGDRIGICAPKSVGVVAAIFGVLAADAAYVPVDPTAPSARSAYIFDDCSVKALIIDRALFEGIRSE